MKEIYSTKNDFVKEIKKLDKRKYRELNRRYKIEGYHLIEEAIKAKEKLEAILLTREGYAKLDSVLEGIEEDKLYIVSEEVLKDISSTPTPQGIVALVKMKDEKLTREITKPLLLLDNVQDPGNVGTMIRTADAANYQGVILGEGCADIYSPKVQRSMQGSNFHIEIIQQPLLNVLPLLKEQGIKVYGTELNPEAIDYRELEKEDKFALIMGNEGQGVSKELLLQTNQNLYIPIEGQAESLNVAVAAGILMFGLK